MYGEQRVAVLRVLADAEQPLSTVEIYDRAVAYGYIDASTVQSSFTSNVTAMRWSDAYYDLIDDMYARRETKELRQHWKPRRFYLTDEGRILLPHILRRFEASQAKPRSAPKPKGFYKRTPTVLRGSIADGLREWLTTQCYTPPNPVVTETSATAIRALVRSYNAFAQASGYPTVNDKSLTRYLKTVIDVTKVSIAGFLGVKGILLRIPPASVLYRP